MNTKQPIILVAAMSRNRVIGRQNKLPWYMPSDMRHFREVTEGKTIIMGRKTFDSIGKRPLPNRKNIVISTTLEPEAFPGCEIVTSLEQALSSAQKEPSDIMIVGGQTLYEQALPIATDIYLTLIEMDIEGDTFFPTWASDEWEEIECIKHKANEQNLHDFAFLKFKRIKPSKSA